MQAGTPDQVLCCGFFFPQSFGTPPSAPLGASGFLGSVSCVRRLRIALFPFPSLGFLDPLKEGDDCYTTVLQETLCIPGAGTLLGIQSSVTFVKRAIQVGSSACSHCARSLQKAA